MEVKGSLNVERNLSGGTIFSGSTNLYSIFQTIESDGNDITRVQNGINTFTGGTSNLPTVNITSATLANLSTSGTSVATQFSATTLSAGIISADAISANTIVAFSFSAITISSVTTVSSSFSAATISGGTIYSGSTNLYDIFLTTNDGNDITRVQNGTNTFTGGTANFPSVNITSATFANLSTSGTSVATQFSATTLSAGTIFSGSTDLYTIFLAEFDILNGGSF